MAEFTPEDDALLGELGVEVEARAEANRTPRQERIIAGFEDIQRFVEQHGHAPEHGEGQDIFERLYAVRLDRLRELSECRELLAPLDHQGLLKGEAREPKEPTYDLDDSALLAELGVATTPSGIGELTHVRSAAEKRAAEEIAKRTPCRDFEQFQPLFDSVTADLKTGLRKTRPFGKDGSIEVGNFFIVNGQVAYVAERGEDFKAPNGGTDARLRVIYANGTESNLLAWSLQRALYKDENGRRITDPDAGPLFSGELKDGDLASGTIYVLRSKSDNPAVAAHRDILHKIGVTGGDIERRIGNARLDPTFLMADVKIVASYVLYNTNRVKLENLIHRVFDAAQLDVEVTDRFGNPVKPREWFLVPLFVIDEAVERIRDGSITAYVYDPKAARLVKAGDASSP
ncbi:MAG: GIY-YIG nuclease family protein [Gammaproteobacteria bacterium PRO9]|nr:GIY-YIG nuclease family protein [Gammaproteobacteria bacterium PRO9]